MEEKAKILLVDDERLYLDILVELLKPDYKLYIAKSAEQAYNRIKENLPDLILMDIQMPDASGYDACERIKANPSWRHIPLIFLTANTDSASETLAFQTGAVDFIYKPIVADTLRVRVSHQINLLRLNKKLTELHDTAVQLNDKRDQAFKGSRDALIFMLVHQYLPATSGEKVIFCKQFQCLLRLLVEQLSLNANYCDILDETTIFDLVCVALVSKMADPIDHTVSNDVTLDQFNASVQTQQLELLLQQAKHFAGVSRFMAMAEEIIRHSHESWDGTGLPLGLQTEQIPLTCRIVKLANAYQSCFANSSMAIDLRHQQALEFLQTESGRSLDPKLVDAFFQIQDDFLKEAKTFDNQ